MTTVDIGIQRLYRLFKENDSRTLIEKTFQRAYGFKHHLCHQMHACRYIPEQGSDVSRLPPIVACSVRSSTIFLRCWHVGLLAVNQCPNA